MYIPRVLNKTKLKFCQTRSSPWESPGVKIFSEISEDDILCFSHMWPKFTVVLHWPLVDVWSAVVRTVP